MKRILVLVALVGALAAPGRLAAQQIHVGLGGQLSSIVHVPIVIPVVADLTGRPEKLGSYSLRLQWNPAVLQITGGGDGTFGGATVNSDSLTAGVLRMAGVNSAGASGVITLVNIELLPLVKAVDTLKLTLMGLYAAGTFADLDSLAVVTNGVYCPARGLWGDIDGDGNANSRDALIALSNAVGLDVSAFDISLGDVDGNGVTNARDALIILSNAVGVDVSAFRVMRLAGGACSAFTGVALSVTPGPVELVRGQTVKFEAWAADSVTGALQAVANPTWKSNASMVLVVGPDGQASARDTGTAVVTALRGTRDSAQTTVHVIARRTTSWVDAVAVNATNRLGTTGLPFGSIEEGLQFAQDGDTLRIRVGRYEIQSGSLGLFRPVVLIGDTAADGSRPTLVPDSSAAGAIDIMTPGRVEVQNLAFSGVSTGVYVSGAGCVLLRGVRMTTTGDGVYLDMPTSCLRIEHSQILGPDVAYYDAPVVGSAVQRSPVQRAPGSAAYVYAGAGVTTDAPVDTLTIEDSEIAGFNIGVFLSVSPDSTTIRRSSVHDNISYAVTTTEYGGCGYGCVSSILGGAAAVRPAPRAHGGRPSVARAPMNGAASAPAAVVIEGSRLARSSNWLVDLEGDLRRVALAHNHLTNPGNNAVFVYANGTGYLSMVGDSIVSPPENQHYLWLDVGYLGSLVIDSLQAVGFAYGSTYDVGLVRMTNSTLRDLRGNCGECSSTGLSVDFGYSITGGVMELHNDSVIGDSRNDAVGVAFATSGARLDADRVTAVNLDRGIYAQGDDSSVTVTNSLFRHVASPIQWYPGSYPAPNADSLTVRGTTFSGFSYAVVASYGRLVADSNTFESGYKAIDFSGPMPVTVTRNQVSGTSYGMQIQSFDSTAVVTVTDNVLSGIGGYGIQASASNYQDPLQTLFDVRRNTVTCDADGATGGTGIDLSEAHLVVLDNQVSGCWAGIRTYVSLPTARGDSITDNAVTAPASAQFGIGVAGKVRARVGRNTVTGAATGVQQAGLIDVVGNCYAWACPEVSVPVALIDSNLVTGGTVLGIHANAVDSLFIMGNTVTNLNSPSGGYISPSEDRGGISVMGYLQYVARIVGNVVKHVAGSGIVVNHPSDTSFVVVDSNVVAHVDSTGVFAIAGPMVITRNLFADAHRDGIRVDWNNSDSLVVAGNNIAGNAPFGLNNLADRTVDASGNWWGIALGPRCDTCASVGDSVSINVTWAPFLTAPNDTAPTVVPAAPRYLARARPMPVVREARSSGPLGAPFAPRDRFAVPRAPAPWPAAANARPATGPMAERRAAEERARAERAVQRAQRLQQLRAEAEARDRALRAAHARPHTADSQEVRP